MNSRMVALMIMGFLLAGRVAAAQEQTGDGAASLNRYLGVVGTYLRPDENRGSRVNDGYGVGFLLGRQWPSGLGLELSLFADLIETGNNGGTDYYRQDLGVDLFYAFGNRAIFTPFVLIGAGYARNDVFPDERDGYDWLANAGVGFVTSTLVFDLFRVRGELRYIYDDFETGSSDYRAGVGIEFPIYRKVVTITETKTEEKVRVVEVYSGLSDEDGDGVVDGRDKCSGTEEGTRVDGSGCLLPKVMTLKGVTFEFDSSRLRPDSRKVLDDVSDILNRYPDMKVEIAGHTDNVGSDDYNQKLSQRRAQSVQNFLVEHGAPPEQIGTAGYGESEPVETNDTEEGRELNRRVELRILN
ncbi:MAG: OmpA family protein [Hydrocarboniphaga effusa]|nr:OmpA family protein [Hydrocarboniphaga effusa]